MGFKLERRFIVIKLEDAEQLSEYYKNQLANILEIIEQERAVRAVRGKDPLRGIFINSRWPEYRPTLKLLADRVEKENGTS